MSRNSPANFNSNKLNFIYAVELNLDDSDLHAWNGYGDLNIEGETYTGMGSLLGISGFEEAVEIAARGVTVTLSGIPQSIVSIALQENYQNRPMRVLVGTLDNGTASVYTMFRGQIDTMTITESGSTAKIILTGENRLIDLERARSSRYTSEDQKTYYPDDLGLDYVADLQDKSIDWGK